jgi:hypothetical protein
MFSQNMMRGSISPPESRSPKIARLNCSVRPASTKIILPEIILPHLIDLHASPQVSPLSRARLRQANYHKNNAWQYNAISRRKLSNAYL